MKRIHFYLIVLLTFSCTQRPVHKDLSKTVFLEDTVQVVTNKDTLTSTAVLEEYYVDSLLVAKKTFNKVELLKYRVLDSNYVMMNFYARTSDHQWRLKQTFQFEKDGIKSCNAMLSDFNHDGFYDLTYISAVAARSANEVRRLFIYDQLTDQLICLKNSEDYPNLRYNEALDCIDAFLIHGGSSTIFLRIKGDSLKAFAGVHLNGGLTVFEVDKDGEEVIIRQDTTTKSEYVRFKNYKPLQRYPDQ